jgi:hypothetical protein
MANIVKLTKVAETNNKPHWTGLACGLDCDREPVQETDFVAEQ